MQKLHLVWLRNDLRCMDNTVLYAAAEQAQAQSAALLVLFVATPATWSAHDMAPIKQDLIRRRVMQLQTELLALNIPLLAIEGSSYKQLPALFNQLCQQFELNVFVQTEYELREQQRDAAVEQIVLAHHGQFIRFDTQCIMPPGTVCTQQGDVYKVFTPFKRTWLKRLHENGLHCVARPKALAKRALSLPAFPLMHAGDESSSAWPVAETDVLEMMRSFCREKVADYQQQRDFPAIDGTSKLSAYLAIGVVSAAQCVARLQLEAQDSWAREKSGAEVWLSELIWREFYKHVLVAYPGLIKHQPFQADTAAIRWSNNPQLFQAWCDGNTGYPIVDAAMRQLNQTGWMHNRLRMIVASFLVKDLHIDWRWGERYFMSKLIDGEFAANNGGWQWAASTGTDAAPYFRIFNPVSQSEKFDPQGVFIRLYVPELSKLQDKTVHWPHKLGGVKGYPSPVVDHAVARKQTLALFAEVKKPL
ncbi:deoxyribodipyrimidine photo-lyase [Rheinheimera maricola]|uniref:Deoxyribodipyrimidine photo-lyase n=1 Tax=Rheinheimera maricola TaxID=2793282 RepID=A0ABS7XDF5_9GAMM|nr:deoxyribodipyrimidine photo-lyase [Rheinheimera maricola]MBZ9613576.1 deoxyribodipyrimidine photo-lyase [Rheinheimera maricola]